MSILSGSGQGFEFKLMNIGKYIWSLIVVISGSLEWGDVIEDCFTFVRMKYFSLLLCIPVD